SGTAYEAPERGSVVGGRGRQQRRGRLQQPRRRTRAIVLHARFAARPTRGPLASPGEYFAPTARRDILPVSEGLQDAGRYLAIARRSRQEPVGVMESINLSFAWLMRNGCRTHR